MTSTAIHEPGNEAYSWQVEELRAGADGPASGQLVFVNHQFSKQH
jgi:hypothetical protein